MGDQRNTAAAISRQFAAAREADEEEQEEDDDDDEEDDDDEDGDLHNPMLNLCRVYEHLHPSQSYNIL